MYLQRRRPNLSRVPASSFWALFSKKCVTRACILIRRAGTGPRYGLKNYTYNLIWVGIRGRPTVLKVPHSTLQRLVGNTNTAPTMAIPATKHIWIACFARARQPLAIVPVHRQMRLVDRLKQIDVTMDNRHATRGACGRCTKIGVQPRPVPRVW